MIRAETPVENALDGLYAQMQSFESLMNEHQQVDWHGVIGSLEFFIKHLNVYNTYQNIPLDLEMYTAYEKKEYKIGVA
ncbi:MAG: hypothetical protein OXP71_12530 [Candidatus Poribacteria bacterium]|nr:hypothetical protein [Candidatus Poribacteria bacterium]